MTPLEEARSASLAKYKAAVKVAKEACLKTEHRLVDRIARGKAILAARAVHVAEMAALDHPAAAVHTGEAVKAAPPASENDG
jgi:hypothetical protein